MNFDFAMKLTGAIVGLIGGIVQVCVNSKTLIEMKNPEKTEQANTESANSQTEEV